MKNDRKAPKPIKSVRKPKRSNEILVCPPDRAGKGGATRFFGISCRAFVTMFAVFGMSLLLNDAIRLGIDVGYLFLVSLISTVVLSAWYIPKVGPFLTLGSVAAYVTINLLTVTKWIEFFISGILSVYNAFLQRLADKNFLRMLEFKVDIPSGSYSKETLVRYGLGIITFLLALSFVPFIVRKTRIIFPAILSTAILVLIFTYNMSNANWAIALVIASFCSIIVLNIFDKFYIKDPAKHPVSADRALFGESDRPPLPDEIIQKQEEKERAEAEREKERIERAELRNAEKNKVKTIDEEISDYFGSSKKPKKSPKKAKNEPEFSPDKQRKKEIAAQLKKVRRYDRISGSARSAMGGFAAMATFVICMMLLVFPALLTNDNFKTIPIISTPMNYFREYLTAFLQGDDIVIDDLEYARNSANFAPHSTTATPRNYKGTQYFFIETAHSTDLYMPGWIATDYKNGSWYTAGYRSDTYNAYRAMYAAIYDRQSTPAEDVYFNFIKYYFPYDASNVEFENNRLYINSAYGFLAEQVNIRRLATIGTYVYMPSKFNSDYKLRKYGLSEESDLTFVNFYDGIYTGQKFNELNADYATVAYTFLQTNPSWINNLAPLMAEFNEGYIQVLQKVLIPRRDKISEYKYKKETLEMIVDHLYCDIKISWDDYGGLTINVPEKYTGAGNYYLSPYKDTVTNIDTGVVWEFDDEEGITTSPASGGRLPFSVRYATMRSKERLEVAEMYYNYFIYRNFVYDTYTSTAESEIITEYYNDLVAKTGFTAPVAGINAPYETTYADRHEFVMNVISSLAGKDSGYTYTLDPQKTPDPSLDGVENFLTVTKEGYCVQFASAVALILREAGIPVRYVEGYIASDMVKYQSHKKDWNYYSIVKDENAHAWIEVWYDGIGWIPYEATPSYYNAAYGIVDPDQQPPDPVDPGDTSDTKPLPGGADTDPPDDTDDPIVFPPAPGTVVPTPGIDPEVLAAIITTVVTVISVGGLVTLAVILIRRRAKKHRDEKAKLLDTAQKLGFSDEERHDAARKLIDMTMKLLTVLGTPPGKFEFRGDYTKRIEKEYLPIFGKKVKKINRHDLTEEELKALEGEEFVTISDTDFTAIFDSIAAEEFGTDGMTAEELAALAIFYKRLYGAMDAKLSSFAIFRYKYFNLI